MFALYDYLVVARLSDKRRGILNRDKKQNAEVTQE